jgi:ketosteroid isomerase-like protein
MLWEPNHPLSGVARRWLEDLQSCIRAVDFPRARPLFADEAVSFGTYATILHGLDDIVQNQWSNVWPVIKDFTFRLDEMSVWGDDEGICVVLPWGSQGKRPDGTPYSRPGRATLLLVPLDGRWQAAHSHFSLAPSPDKDK